nr:MAG TPA: Vpu protein [Caudoviricetes sp.]
MLIILSIASFIINIAVILILFQIICYETKKYIKERIKRNLELLDKLEEIGKDIDSKIDGLKIMIYDRYLDRCRAGMKKQREEDKGLRDKLTEIESKCSK